MTKFLVVTLLFVGFFTLSEVANAHPGGLASDGAHYCRTNCDHWGEEWNKRHCHRCAPRQPVATQATVVSTRKYGQRGQPGIIGDNNLYEVTETVWSNGLNTYSLRRQYEPAKTSVRVWTYPQRGTPENPWSSTIYQVTATEWSDGTISYVLSATS